MMLTRTSRTEFSTYQPPLACLAALIRKSVLAGLLLMPALSLGQAFVQENNNTVAETTASVSVTYGAAETAGNLNVVVVGWSRYFLFGHVGGGRQHQHLCAGRHKLGQWHNAGDLLCPQHRSADQQHAHGHGPVQPAGSFSRRSHPGIQRVQHDRTSGQLDGSFGYFQPRRTAAQPSPAPAA